jgi:hypothetical protein
MGDKAWKKMERRVAEKMGGQRVVCSGVRGEGDVLNDKFFIECKERKSFAIWDWFTKAKAEAKKEGKVPLLVLKEKGKHGELAVVDMDWFASQKFGEAVTEKEAEHGN